MTDAVSWNVPSVLGPNTILVLLQNKRNHMFKVTKIQTFFSSSLWKTVAKKNWTLWDVGPAPCLGLLETFRLRDDNPRLYRSLVRKRTPLRLIYSNMFFLCALLFFYLFTGPLHLVSITRIRFVVAFKLNENIYLFNWQYIFIMNQTEFSLVGNQKENCQCNHINYNSTENWNLVLWRAGTGSRRGFFIVVFLRQNSAILLNGIFPTISRTRG